MADQETTDTSDKINTNYYMECKINDEVVPNRAITYMAVREWAFDDQRLPRIEMTLYDDGFFTDIDLPYQGKKIDIFIARDISEKDSQLTGTFLQAIFMIADFTYNKAIVDQIGNPSIIQISGYLDCTNLVTEVPDKCYENMTSLDVVKEISGDLGLSLFNLGKPADKMNWMSNNQTPLQIIDHVVSKSFIADNDVALCYIDHTKTINYVSFLEAISKNNIIKAVLNRELAELNTRELLVKKAESLLQLSEKEATTTLWYSSLDLSSSAGSFYVKYGGYGYVNRVLDLSTGSYKLSDSKSKDNPGLSLKTTNIQAYKEYLKTTENPIESFPETPKYTVGNISVLNEKSIENVYGFEYLTAEHRRKHSIALLMSQSIVVESSPIVPVSLMDVVDLVVPSNVPVEENSTNAIIGGKYIVLGITYLIDGAFYKKMISLHRVGWNKTSNKKE